MKIALIGFGNMGKELETLVHNTSEDSIVSISYKTREDSLDVEGIAKADVAIDFTSADIVVDTLHKIITLGTPVVIGTTGWYDKFEQVKKLVKENNLGCVYGQNFSIGANMFFRMLAFSAHLMSKFDMYDVYGLEVHHTGKKDSPSGTARKVSDILLQNFKGKDTVMFDRLDREIQENELHFASLRGGRNPGRHDVIFDSFADEIHLSHQAHGRSGFAEGALLAAKFIVDKKGMYSFDEVFERQVKENETI